jgi:hypothetical protein
MQDISPTSGQIATADSDELLRRIHEHLKRGAKAEAKAEEHYISAGLLIRQLKEAEPANWQALVQERCGLGRSRSYELLKIADGKATAEEIRKQTNERSRRHVTASVANGLPKTSEIEATQVQIEAAKPAEPKVETQVEAKDHPDSTAEDRKRQYAVAEAMKAVLPATTAANDRHDDHHGDHGEPDVGSGQPADNPVITAWVGATSEQRAEFAKYVSEQKSQSQLGKALAAISDPTKTLTAALVTKAIDPLPHDLFMQGFIVAQRLRAALAEADAAEKLSTSTYSQTKLIKNGSANAVVP